MNESGLASGINSQNFFDFIPGLYLILTPDLMINAVTDAYLTSTMKTRDSILGRYFFDEFPDNLEHSNTDGISKLKESLNIVLTQKIPHNMEIIKYDIFSPDGDFKIRYWKIENSPLFDKNGQVNYIIHKTEDVTEMVLLHEQEYKSDLKHKVLAESLEIKVQEKSVELSKLKDQLKQEILEREKTDESLRKNEGQLKLITDAMPVLISYMDHEEKLRFNNKTYQEWFSVAPKQLYGKTMREIAGEQVYRVAGPNFKKALSGQSVTYETLADFPTDGKRFIRATYIPHIYNDNVVGCFAMVEDISREKEIEEKLINHNEELERFAYIASHDLQEPLRMISSYSQLLAKKYKEKLDEDANEFIDFILDGSKRMKILIEDILSHSKISRKENSQELTDLNKIIESVKFILQLSIDETNTNLILDELPTVKAEKTHMLQLFQNLISNALKYRQKNINPVINISVEKSGDQWFFSIKDNGIGISKENFENIFIIFKRLHSRNEYEGTGIGLANCKKIVEIYGGKIWVEAAEGSGSTFYFTLPV